MKKDSTPQIEENEVACEHCFEQIEAIAGVVCGLVDTEMIESHLAFVNHKNTGSYDFTAEEFVAEVETDIDNQIDELVGLKDRLYNKLMELNGEGDFFNGK